MICGGPNENQQPRSAKNNKLLPLYKYPQMIALFLSLSEESLVIGHQLCMFYLFFIGNKNVQA
jgi:hypothetical protein